MKANLLISAAAMAMLATGASAQTVVPLGAFHSVGISGMGHVILAHGDTQRVTILKGDTTNTTFRIENGSLNIESCKNQRCPDDYQLEVQIVTPGVTGVAIDGSGKIETTGAFPAQDKMDVAISGSGNIDVRAIPAGRSNTAIDGSGDVRLRVSNALNAAISGSGKIVYVGNPHVIQVISGSGEIKQGS